jgi:hypothetical protein
MNPALRFALRQALAAGVVLLVAGSLAHAKPPRQPLPAGVLAAAGPAEPADRYRIAGRVINADSGAPLPGAEVAILTVINGEPQSANEDLPRRGRRGRRPAARMAVQSATAAEDGSFAFENVPAGKYSLQGSHRGFITASYEEHGLFSTAIVVGPGIAPDRLTLKLSPGASIGGAILDSAGEPVDQAIATLYRLSDDGLGSIRMVRSDRADDLGAYEFAHLGPGTYFVSAAGRVWYATARAFAQPPASAGPAPDPPANLDLAYPRTYYADASDSSAATPIPIRGGEHLRADLHLEAVPAVHLTYTLPAATNGGFRNWDRPTTVSQSIFGQNESGMDAVTAMTPGSDHGQPTMSISVAPGEYEVEIGGRMLQVNAGGDAVIDPLTGTPFVELSGKLAATGGGELTLPVYVTLRSAGGQGSEANVQVGNDGSFRFQGVRPGSYEVGAVEQRGPLALVQVAVQGAEVSGNTIRVGSQAVTLAATVAPASAIVSGFARQAGVTDETAPTGRVAGIGAFSGTDGAAYTGRAVGEPASQPASGVMIVLAPQRLEEHALFRRDQSDSDGSFSLRQVAPGNYTLLAIRDGWDLEWAKPEVITHYLHGGQPIKVTLADKGVLHVPRPVMVQAR